MPNPTRAKFNRNKIAILLFLAVMGIWEPTCWIIAVYLLLCGGIVA